MPEETPLPKKELSLVKLLGVNAVFCFHDLMPQTRYAVLANAKPIPWSGSVELKYLIRITNPKIQYYHSYKLNNIKARSYYCTLIQLVAIHLKYPFWARQPLWYPSSPGV
jgi:hypothetical protein